MPSVEAALTAVLPLRGATAAAESAPPLAESAPLLTAVPQEASHWEPFLPGLVVLLPLLGFVANALLALSAARRSSVAVRAGKEWDPFASAVRPRTHTLPTWIGPGVMAGAFVLAAVNFATAFAAHLEEPVIAGPYWTWIATETLRVDAALHLDPLSLAMMLVVTGVGFLIHVFSVGYMRDDPGYPRYFAYLNLFVFFMLVLVLGSGYATMFVGWEGVGLCSYLLIGYWFSDREKSDAGKKAFIVNRIGDFGFLLAVFLIFQAFGALDFVTVAEGAEGAFAYGGATVTAVTLLLMLGAAGKSAQVPLHVWLPDAMAGPTPVSALIHAATMVTAGVYMVVRSSALYALAPTSQAVVAGVGVLTAFVAATIALKQHDIKKVLAYSTVSQLGFMFLAAGVGAYAAAVFHLVTHAFFKALLFLGAGAVIHAMHHAVSHGEEGGDAADAQDARDGADAPDMHDAADAHDVPVAPDPQDMRNMGGLRKHMPVTWAVMGIATLAIAGIWPFAGFFSKDEIIWYAGAWAGAESNAFGGLYQAYWALALVTALLTAFYMARLMVMTFHGANRTGPGASRLHEAPRVMTVPLVILAALSVAGGFLNVPEVLHGTALGLFGAVPAEWLHHWLGPVIHAAEEIQVGAVGAASKSAPLGGGELAWALASTAAAALVVVATFRALGRRTFATAADDPGPAGPVARFLHGKWYFDEAYDRIVVRPVLAASRWCWNFLDARVIDGIVNFTGNITRFVGMIASFFQTGQVNMYAFVLALGALLVLGAAVLLP